MLPPLLSHVGSVLSILTVRLAGQTLLFPALSYTVPGDAVVVLIFESKVFVVFPLQPLPPVSLHIPVIVTFWLVQLEDPPLEVQVGAVLSILTVWSAGQVLILPALSLTIPGDWFVLLVLESKVFVALPVQPLPPLSLHVPIKVIFWLVQLFEPPLLSHDGTVLSTFTI